MDRLLEREGTGSPEPIIQKNTRTINRKNLINRLNYMNFQDRDIISVFKHRQYNQHINIKVRPGPCNGEMLHCSWITLPEDEIDQRNFVFDHLQLDDGMSTISFGSDNYTLDDDGLNIMLPETGLELISRRARRHSCKNIRAQMIQNGIIYKGSLKSFSTESVRVEMDSLYNQNISFLNMEESMTVTFINSQHIVFSGEMKIFKHSDTEGSAEIILMPLYDNIHRFKHQEERFTRTAIIPGPNLSFTHPLTGQVKNLLISDISGSGFSVEEELHDGSLLPGMIIPAAEIVFSEDVKILCKIQIIYRAVSKEREKQSALKIGICFLDMTPRDHARLMAIVFQAQNKYLYLGREVDNEAFWQFIFESGFIYPKKYSHLSQNKDAIRKMYRKIYSHSPEVYKYITYQDKGRILGHIAMLRVYEKAWLLHHHASSSVHNHNAGVSVMVMMADYAYSAHRIPSLHLDYLMIYYRPENKFPARVFGGYRKLLGNKKGCSEDDFAYTEITADRDGFFDETDSAHLVKSTARDLVDLKGFYSGISGGLMLKAMDILPSSSFNKDITSVYKRDNLRRDFEIISLKKGDTLLAVFLIDRADTGINMSELANSIKVFIVTPREVTKELLSNVIKELVRKYYEGSARVLIYPVSYADEQGFPYEKKYTLWITGFDFTDKYFKFIRRLLRMQKTND